ncbi:MAG: hypothetical protein JWO33_2969 [Caulobacteraceae bacterium]|nr:hypothetical protein [Caulobacteraceae bacterium]
MGQLAALLIRALMVWVLIAIAESVHGILRRLFLQPVVGDLAASRIGVLTGVVLIIAIATITSDWLRLRSSRDCLLIGLLWVAFTLAFEIGLGRILGVSWARLASDYDLSRGAWLPGGFAIMALTPLLIRWFRTRGASLARDH